MTTAPEKNNFNAALLLALRDPKLAPNYSLQRSFRSYCNAQALSELGRTKTLEGIPFASLGLTPTEITAVIKIGLLESFTDVSSGALIAGVTNPHSPDALLHQRVQIMAKRYALLCKPKKALRISL